MTARQSAVLMLGSAQTLAWASSFYLPAMLAAPMARDLGVGTPTVFGALSMALIVSALVSPAAGRAIDRHGGRPVLVASTVLFIAGLSALAAASGPLTLLAAWALLGLAMGCGLYDAAFAALVWLYGRDARSAITGITLIAGFASTVGWPLTAWMEAHWGWRGACCGWALLHALMGLPLNALLPRTAAPPPAGATPSGMDPAPLPQPPRRTAPVLALLFAMTGFVSTAVATHLPALLLASGASMAGAVAVAALLGPSQVVARLIELGVWRHASPMVAARAAMLGHPLAAGVLLVLGGAGALPFVVLHGLGNGLLTIVRGTLPLALFGAAGYGARQGWISMPARVAGALSPWLFGIVFARWGTGALVLTCGLGVAAFALLLLLHEPGPSAR